MVTLLVFGLGYGVASPSIQTAGIETAPADKVGAAAGLLSASRYVGSITSTLVLASVVRDDGRGLQTMLLVSAASLAVGLVVASRLPTRGPNVLDAAPMPRRRQGGVALGGRSD